jgi:hypothetical protein
MFSGKDGQPVASGELQAAEEPTYGLAPAVAGGAAEASCAAALAAAADADALPPHAPRAAGAATAASLCGPGW